MKRNHDDPDRLNALRRYDILDTPPDGAFDRITDLVAQILNVPIAIVSLVDTDRIWFKSHYGLDASEVDLAPGLCASAILEDKPYILGDASMDARALSNPLVAGQMGFRFYAGVPLTTYDNHNLGVLCAIDFHPRQITEKELNTLKTLAQVVMDEMELRRSVRQVHHLHSEMEQLIHSAGIGVYGVDENLDLTFWNRAAEKITGFSREDISSCTPIQAMHQPQCKVQELEELRFPLTQSATQGTCFVGEIGTFWHKDGQSFTVEYTITPILHSGKSVGAVAVFKDITEQRHAEAALRKTEKIEAVGQLGAGIAHEIGNPLTTIKGFLQLLSRDKQENDYIHVMQQEADRIEFIAHEFLAFSKGQPMSLEVLSIEDILTDVKQILEREALLKKVTLQFESNPSTPRLQCDKRRITQVLVNVVKNAIDAMPQGGIVSATTKLDVDQIFIQVVDEGHGIDPSRLQNLYEPFYSTKEQGTGLGLMMSQKLVKLHHGDIQIQSQVGKGTTVQIWLPVSSKRAFKSDSLSIPADGYLH